MSYFGNPIRNGASIGLGALAPLGSNGLNAPSLSFNFTSGVLDSQITFTRASTGTYFDSTGALQSAAINAPRFDYNPTTLQPLGLLIEEQRTNRLLGSAEPISQSVTVTAVAYTLSFYGAGTVAISGTGTGTLVGSGAFPTRSTLTFTPTAGVVILTITGTVTQAQLEAGPFATSYIPTIAVAVTRAPDAAAINTLSPWYNATEGTFAVKFQTEYTTAANLTRYILLADSSSIKRIAYISATSINANTFDGTTILIALGNIVSGASKVASTYSATARKICANGNAVTSGAVAAGYPATTSINLSNVGSELCGWYTSLSYYPRVFSNAQLQSITV